MSDRHVGPPMAYRRVGREDIEHLDESIDELLQFVKARRAELAGETTGRGSITRIFLAQVEEAISGIKLTNALYTRCIAAGGRTGEDRGEERT